MRDIEKIIKVNPDDLLYIFNFINSVLDWDRNEFIKVMENVVKNRKNDRNLFSVRIKPNFLMVPLYSYFFAPQTVMKDFGFDIAYEDTINIEKISQFKIFKIPDKVDATISINVGPGIGGFSGERLRAWGIRFGIENKFKEDDRAVDISVYFGNKRDYELLKMELETLKKSQGKSFHRIANFVDPRAAKEIYGVEKSMFIIYNFIYTLYTGEYTGEFGEGDPQAGLLTSFAKVIKSYGETFEEVLDAIKIASFFI
jgi:hypothetical protein